VASSLHTYFYLAEIKKFMWNIRKCSGVAKFRLLRFACLSCYSEKAFASGHNCYWDVVWATLLSTRFRQKAELVLWNRANRWFVDSKRDVVAIQLSRNLQYIHRKSRCRIMSTFDQPAHPVIMFWWKRGASQSGPSLLQRWRFPKILYHPICWHECFR